MNGEGANAEKRRANRVCLVASPRLFVDSLSRTLSLAGWTVDAICSDVTQLAAFERTMSDSHTVVIVDGPIPAPTLACEIVRRRPGQRVVVIGGETKPGVAYIQLPATAGLVELIRSLESQVGAAALDRRQLTARHVEILQLVARGYTTDEVGETLGIAPKTVNNHLSAVYRRLKAKNLTQAVLRAARAGLVDVSSGVLEA